MSVLTSNEKHSQGKEPGTSLINGHHICCAYSSDAYSLAERKLRSYSV